MAFLWHYSWLKFWINDKQDIIVCNLITEQLGKKKLQSTLMDVNFQPQGLAQNCLYD